MIEFFLQNGTTFEGETLEKVQQKIVDFCIDEDRDFSPVEKIIYYTKNGEKLGQVSEETISNINTYLEEEIDEAREAIKIEARGLEATKSDYRNSI